MSSPATAARTTLITLLTTEFGADNFVVRADKLDKSLGFDGAVSCVCPLRERPNSRARLELQTTIQVQLFGHWDPQTDPNEIVDPTTVEAWADRFRTMIGGYTQTGTSRVWWFQLDEIVYENDPTGNCTRFCATVIARGDNPAS